MCGPIRVPGPGSGRLAPEPSRRARRAGSRARGCRAWCGCGCAPRRVLESPVAKFLSEAHQRQIVAATGAEPGDLVLVVAGERERTCKVLGQLRLDLGQPAISERPFRFVWITEFPLFEGMDDEGHLVAAHHPFTMPHPDDIDLLETDPMAVRSQSYDLVLNGWELGSGSIRIHRADIQRRVFKALGISDEDAESRFGFLLGAFRYGAPPHGGFAVGLDRFVALLAGEDNIREVIAYPKTQSGADLMSGAPKPLTAKVLADLGIRVVAPQVPGSPATGCSGDWVCRARRARAERDAEPAQPSGQQPPARPVRCRRRRRAQGPGTTGGPPAPHPAGRGRRPAPSSRSRRTASRPGRGRPAELSGVLRASGHGQDDGGTSARGAHGAPVQGAVRGRCRRKGRAKRARRRSPGTGRGRPRDDPVPR